MPQPLQHLEEARIVENLPARHTSQLDGFYNFNRELLLQPLDVGLLPRIVLRVGGMPQECDNPKRLRLRSECWCHHLLCPSAFAPALRFPLPRPAEYERTDPLPADCFLRRPAGCEL